MTSKCSGITLCKTADEASNNIEDVQKYEKQKLRPDCNSATSLAIMVFFIKEDSPPEPAPVL
jgi:hypothetical protein